MTNADTDERELLRLNAEYRRCIVQRDVEGSDRLLADDYFVVGPDGERVENKEDGLSYLKEPGNVTEYLELSDAAVRVYGDSGVVHGVVTSGGTFGGRPFTDRVREAHWYTKWDGRWQAVMGQGTPVVREWRRPRGDQDEGETFGVHSGQQSTEGEPGDG